MQEKANWIATPLRGSQLTDFNSLAVMPATENKSSLL